MMMMKAATLYDAGKPCGAEANAATYLAGEFGFEACTRAEIGRAHVCTPVTNAQLVCSLLPEEKTATKICHSPRTHTPPTPRPPPPNPTPAPPSHKPTLHPP